MKLTVEKIPGLTEIEVNIRHDHDEEIIRIVAMLNHETTIIGKKGERNYPLSPSDIYYFESVDEKVFAYDKTDIYQIKERLYELESLLSTRGFSRVSISVIVNRHYIDHFKSSLNGRIEAKLSNGEAIIVSRNYVKDLKMALGGDRK